MPPCPQVVEVYGFSSERKMASVLVRKDTCLRLYNKVRICMLTWCFSGQSPDPLLLGQAAQ